MTSWRMEYSDWYHVRHVLWTVCMFPVFPTTDIQFLEFCRFFWIHSRSDRHDNQLKLGLPLWTPSVCDNSRCWYSMYFDSNLLGVLGTVEVNHTTRDIFIEFLQFPIELRHGPAFWCENLCLPNQVVHDPDTWTTPHLLQLKREYEVLVDKYGCSV